MRASPATPIVAKSRTKKPRLSGTQFTHWNNPSRLRAQANEEALQRRRSAAALNDHETLAQAATALPGQSAVRGLRDSARAV